MASKTENVCKNQVDAEILAHFDYRGGVKIPQKLLHNMRRSQKKWFIVIILKTDDEMGIRRANFLLFLSLSKLSIS